MLDARWPLATTVDELRWDEAVSRLWMKDAKSPWYHYQGYLMRGMETRIASQTKSSLFPETLSLRAQPFRKFTTPPVVNHNGVFDLHGNRVADWCLISDEDDLRDFRLGAVDSSTRVPTHGEVRPVLPGFAKLPPLFFDESAPIHVLDGACAIASGFHWMCAVPVAGCVGEDRGILHQVRQLSATSADASNRVQRMRVPPALFMAFMELAATGAAAAICDAPSPGTPEPWDPEDFWYTVLLTDGKSRRLSCGMMWSPVCPRLFYTVDRIRQTGLYRRAHLVVTDEAADLANLVERGTAVIKEVPSDIRHRLAVQFAAPGDLVDERGRVWRWCRRVPCVEENDDRACVYYRSRDGWRISTKRPPDECVAAARVTKGASPWLLARLVAQAFPEKAPLRVAWAPRRCRALCWSDAADVVLYQRGIVSWEAW